VNLLRDTSWDALLAFAEFAQDCNFTRAADRLHISQPALHTKISNLARRLGAPLYIRRGRQIEVTEAGRKVQRFARELAASAAAFEAELEGPGASQSVSLCAGEGTYLYLLGPAIRAFRADTKHTLRLETANRDSALEAVLSARVQLGVAPLENMPQGVVTQSLTSVGQVLAMPSRHPLAQRKSVRLTDLAGAMLVLPPAGRPHRTMMVQMLQARGVEWHIAVEATGWELMLHFVRLGLGLAVVNACCHLPAGVTARPIPELPAIHYRIFHLERRLPKPVGELKRILLSNADQWQD
jgi:LysR family transcriptional regulator, low CO2-responsive transcriptional regulator